ncbi:PD-(D/E)XK nuclease family protein [Lacihabitans soyangensis]|uniref:PD-(D/E)XK nuclease superfamily protein n=1 Tax=Lacihabitans soyangensis TaxID=869394 RepID=A0AAE3H4S1_9BACT|nr:PD-(D/E)XK nuclease family protein [Lacihabitans soyangensis]MCP9762975.1 hypothetical protein [Lacihabitans soyangensis]
MMGIQQQFSFLSNPLISSFQKEKEPNLLEIARVSHKELTVSNLYAYFLNKSESHGLGSLFLDSLIELLPTNSFVIGDEPIRIEREVYTFGTGKFIDVVITDGNQVIVIENKVYATLYNDLEAYKSHFKVKNLVGIVLSSRKEQNTGGFEAITHKEWLTKILYNYKISTDISLSPRQEYNFYTFVEILRNMNNTIDDLDNTLAFFKTNAEQILALQKMKSSFAKVILEQISLLVQNIGFVAIENKKDLSLEYTFSDAPSLILYIYLEDSDLSLLKVALWIRNNPDLVYSWRNTDRFKNEKIEICNLGLLVVNEANPLGGNSWTPIVRKHYSLKSIENLLDLTELQNDLKSAWEKAINTLKTITNP